MVQMPKQSKLLSPKMLKYVDAVFMKLHPGGGMGDDEGEIE